MSYCTPLSLTTALHHYLAPLTVRALRLHCVAEKPFDVHIPELRATWGMVLHHLDKDLFQTVFEGIHPLLPSGQKQPQYIVRPDLKCSYASRRKKFSYEFITWNQTEFHYATLLHAWKEVGIAGLGKERIPFHIETVEPLGSPDPRHGSTLVCPHGLRLLRRGRLVTEPTFYDVILATLYRLGPLVAMANGKRVSARPSGDWLLEAQQILDLAKSVQSEWFGEQKIALHHYSARQQREVDQTGVSGLMHITEFSEDLLPLLAVADVLHVGKATIMGLGRVITKPDV